VQGQIAHDPKIPVIAFIGFTRSEGTMAYSSSRLPSRFPVGTKFVIEGRPAKSGKPQVFSRFIEFPDGTKLTLPKRTLPNLALSQKSAPAGRRSRIKRARAH